MKPQPWCARSPPCAARRSSATTSTPVHEENSPSLAKKWARDCTCGLEWFTDYQGRIVEKAKKTAPKPVPTERSQTDADRIGAPS